MPNRLLSRVDPACRLALAEPKARMLIASQEPSELKIFVSLDPTNGARHVAPQHRNAAQKNRVFRQAKYRAGQQVQRSSTHKVLSVAGSHAPRPDALLARSHWPQMHEPQRLVVHALRKPTEHAAAMTVDSIPHDLAHEPTDFLEAFDAIELSHADRHFVATYLRNYVTCTRVDEIGLPGRRT